ncbi:DUF4192 domain-containing protein [Streptomyces nodosus]|uniref:DUF4192 domain-containing protein n=1 Tax=Streptomyces nodosus TaxID=40318 RepID=UPI00382E4749
MTNHDEAAGRSGIGDMGGFPHRGGEHPAYSGPGPTTGPGGDTQVTLRTPAELADALPYLLGHRPEDSIVLVALHDRERWGRFGGRARLGIPAHSDDWAVAARQLAHGLVRGSERRGARPESMIAYLVQEPASGETGRDVVERLRPLAQLLRTACGSLDIPVVEALCLSAGRFWSYCCPSPGCCPPEGRPMGLPGTSVMAAAAAYAGLRVRGSLEEFRARLRPWETAAAIRQEAVLDTASLALVPRILGGDTREEVAEETLALAERVMARLAGEPTDRAALAADLRDDELLGHDEAAALILGLQDRATRDRAAEWMEGAEATVALRLWRALARRCVGSYGEHAAAPLTLAGWVAWSTGDELEAREALAMAMAADPDYLFARLLHQACNEGLDPETVRRCLRRERSGRTGGARTTAATPTGTTAPPHAEAVAGDRRRIDEDDRPARAGAGGDGPERRPTPAADEPGSGACADASPEGRCPPDAGSGPFTASPGSAQATPPARPARSAAAVRPQRRARPMSDTGRPVRRPSGAAGGRHRDPLDAPPGRPHRRAARGATSRCGTHLGSGRRKGEGDT